MALAAGRSEMVPRNPRTGLLVALVGRDGQAIGAEGASAAAQWIKLANASEVGLRMM
jgi:hypothetical protein